MSRVSTTESNWREWWMTRHLSRANGVQARVNADMWAKKTTRAHIVPRSLLSWLALDNIGWSRTERKSCFPMSLTPSSYFRDRNKYGGLWRRWINFFKGCSLLQCDLSTSTPLSLQHEPYSAMLISVTRRREWRQRHRKTRFSFGSSSPYVT